MAEMMMYDSSMLLWVDETGCDGRKLVHDHGYVIRGIPSRDHTLKLSGKRYSVTAAMSKDGVEDIYIQEGIVNGAIFLDFICRCLIPVLMPFNGHNPILIVIMDNASVHKGGRVQELTNGVGALLRFSPAYSPDLNPIEEVFAEVKGYLKANGVFKATSSPQTLINLAFSSVPKDNCVLYIHHSGYSY